MYRERPVIGYSYFIDFSKRVSIQVCRDTIFKSLKAKYDVLKGKSPAAILLFQFPFLSLYH